MAYEGPEYWFVIYKAIADFGDLMRDARQAKQQMQDMADQAKAFSSADATSSQRAAELRRTEIQQLQQESQALRQLGDAAKATNTQLLYGGRNDMQQHLGDMDRLLLNQNLLNRAQWMGFSTVQQAMAYRQQMYQAKLLENKAEFGGYLTADQYLAYMAKRTQAANLDAASVRARALATSDATAAMLAYDNAVQGSHKSISQLGQGVSAVNALSDAVTAIPDASVTRLVLDDGQFRAQLLIDEAMLAMLTRPAEARVKVGVPVRPLGTSAAGTNLISGAGETGALGPGDGDAARVLREEMDRLVQQAVRSESVNRVIGRAGQDFLGGNRFIPPGDLPPAGGGGGWRPGPGQLALPPGAPSPRALPPGEDRGPGFVMLPSLLAATAQAGRYRDAIMGLQYSINGLSGDERTAAAAAYMLSLAQKMLAQDTGKVTADVDELQAVWSSLTAAERAARAAGAFAAPEAPVPARGPPELSSGPDRPALPPGTGTQFGDNPMDDELIRGLRDDMIRLAAAEDDAGRGAGHTATALLATAVAAKAMSGTIPPMVDGLIKSTGGWFGLNSQLRLFGGLLPGIMGHVAAWHVLVDFIIEGLAVFVPALVTLIADLGAFGLAGSDAAKEVYNRIIAIHTASDALDQTLAPMTGHLEALHDQVRPMVWELYGDAIDVVHAKTGLFNQLAILTGTTLDRLAAHVTVFLTNASKGLETFFSVGNQDLAKLGVFFDNLGQALLAFIKITQITHIDQYFLDFFVALSQVLVLITRLPAPLLAAAFALHAFWLWGGLAATVVMQLLSPLRALALALGAVDAAEVAGGLAGLDKDASAFARLKAGLTDIAAGFGALPGRLNMFSKAAKAASADAEGIAAGELAMEEGAAGAAGGTEALAGGFGTLLGIPVIGWAVALAAALVGVGVYLGLRTNQTQAWIEKMDTALTKVGTFKVVGQTMADLAAATQQLASSQRLGTGDTTELANAQADLSGKLSRELDHVGQVSHAYGTDMVGALSLLNAAGVKTSDLFTAQGRVWAQDLQQVKGLVDGYKAMGQGMSEIQRDVSVQLVLGSDQYKSMQNLNAAWDNFQKVTAGPFTGIIKAAQDVEALTGATGGMVGLGKAALDNQKNFQGMYADVETLFSAIRSADAVTGDSGFAGAVKHAVQSLIPLAGGNKAAVAEISQLAQEAGGPATDSLAALAKWAGNTHDPLKALYQDSLNATVGASNLDQDAARLSATLQNDLNPAMANAAFNAFGGQKAFNTFASDLVKFGPDAQPTIDAGAAVARELLAVDKNSASAKAQFVGWAESMGYSKAQADKLWDSATRLSGTKYELQLTDNIAAEQKKIDLLKQELATTTDPAKRRLINLQIHVEEGKLADLKTKLHDAAEPAGALRKSLAGASGAAADLAKPGLWGQIEHQFMSLGDKVKAHPIAFAIGGAFNLIPGVTKALDAVGHALTGAGKDVGRWFTQSLPQAWDTTYQSFMRGFATPLTNWFTQSLPHGLAAAWDKAWSELVAPVTRAFDAVKHAITGGFDGWWKGHGDEVKEVWHAVTLFISAAWDDAIGKVKGAWRTLVSWFTGPGDVHKVLAAMWGGVVGAAKEAATLIEGVFRVAWSVIVVGAKIAWAGIVMVAKTSFDIIASVLKTVWDAAMLVIKIGWAVAIAGVKIAWDIFVGVVSVALDLLTGHWGRAWADMKKAATQVWNALKTLFESIWKDSLAFLTQLWHNFSSLFVQIWNNAFTFLKGGWNTLWHWFDATIIGNFRQFFTKTIPQWWDSFVTGGTNALKQIASAIEGAFKNSVNWVIDHVINGAINIINDVTGIVGIPKIKTVGHVAAAGGVMHSGGSVPGTGDEDGTHVIAMGGEYMLRKPARMALESVYGRGYMDHLNQADQWLGSGSRGNFATQGRAAGGRFAAGGPLPADLGTGIGPSEAQMTGWFGGLGDTSHETAVSFAGRRIQVNKMVAGTVQAIGSAIASTYPGYVDAASGGFRQTIGASTSNIPYSMHQLGLAIDVNPDTNPYLGTTGSILEHPKIIDIFRQHGWFWGGNWGSGGRDQMHFQLEKTNGMAAGGGGIWQSIEGLLNAVGSALSGKMGPLLGYFKGGAAEALKFAKLGGKAVFDQVWKDAIQPLIDKVIPAGGTSAAGSTLQYVAHGIKAGVDTLMGQKDTEAKVASTFSGGAGIGDTGGAALKGTGAAAAQAWMHGHLGDYGWGEDQWPSLLGLWNGESGWRWDAQNPASPAYGIPQADPGSKMAAAGSDWRTNPVTQMRWGAGYIKGTPGYGSPFVTYGKWLARSPHWYATGGEVPVPELAGFRAGQAHNILQAAGLRPTAAKGQKAGWWTTGTAPRATTHVPPHSAVDIHASASSRPEGIRLPDLSGYTAGTAHNILSAEGLVPTAAKGQKATWPVTGSSPGKGTGARAGERVQIIAPAPKTPGPVAVPPPGTLVPPGTDPGQAWTAYSGQLAAAKNAEASALWAYVGANLPKITTAQWEEDYSDRLILAWQQNKLFGAYEKVMSGLSGPADMSGGEWTDLEKQAASQQNWIYGAVPPKSVWGAEKTGGPGLGANWPKGYKPGTYTPSGWARWKYAHSQWAAANSKASVLRTTIGRAYNAWNALYGPGGPLSNGVVFGGGSPGVHVQPAGAPGTPGITVDLEPLIGSPVTPVVPTGPSLSATGSGFALGGPVGGDGGSLGQVAQMFALGGLVPSSLPAPVGLPPGMARQLGATTAAQGLPRTMSEAGDRIGVNVGSLTVNNPVPEKPSDTIARSSNRLAFLAGRGPV